MSKSRPSIRTTASKQGSAKAESAAPAVDRNADVKQGLPVISFDGPEAFETWVAGQPSGSKGLWLKMAKKGSERTTVTHAQALEAALCHGWIDGQVAPFDTSFWLQKFTPRGPRSNWSKINRDKALALIKAKRMKPPGLAAI
jgi:uncharacterized protein YdeI (YjbR/CyaY-like superfamily)